MQRSVPFLGTSPFCFIFFLDPSRVMTLGIRPLQEFWYHQNERCLFQRSMAA